MLHNARENISHYINWVQYICFPGQKEITMKLRHVSAHTVVIKIGPQSTSATKLNQTTIHISYFLNILFQKSL